jgi:hypothetical protein
MRARSLPILMFVSALAIIALALAGSASSIPPAPPDPTCSPGPADCGAWHTSNVSVTWSAPPPGVTASGCDPITITEDTGGRAVTCTWSDGSGSRNTMVNVRRDATPPSVRAALARGPDSNGWYNHGVTVEFSGDDGVSGIAGCSSGSYSGPDAAKASITGSCTNGAGLSGSKSVEIAYDATAPTAAAKPERNPNASGWYNRPVSVGFVGTDPVSGVDSCSTPVLYKGPDTAKTSLSGTCRDKAANTSQPAGFELKYDTVPPSLKGAKVEIGRRGVVLKWTASTDAFSYAISRRPGLRGKKPSRIYTGRKPTFTDRRLENGVRYRYTVTAYDVAGNGAAQVLLARPTSVEVARIKPTSSKPTRSKPALTRPAAGARLSVPPLLTWATVPKAAYYNVQLYRNGAKILTAWPRHAKFRLQTRWTYSGRTYVLSPGRYRWFVWPGFGLPSASRYGKLVGTRQFVVVRP